MRSSALTAHPGGLSVEVGGPGPPLWQGSSQDQDITCSAVKGPFALASPPAPKYPADAPFIHSFPWLHTKGQRLKEPLAHTHTRIDMPRTLYGTGRTFANMKWNILPTLQSSLNLVNEIIDFFFYFFKHNENCIKIISTILNKTCCWQKYDETKKHQIHKILTKHEAKSILQASVLTQIRCHFSQIF